MKYSLKTLNNQNGFTTYFILIIMILVSLPLTVTLTHLKRHHDIIISDIHHIQLRTYSDMALQIGFLRLLEEIDDLDDDITSYTLPIGNNDTALSSQRASCLNRQTNYIENTSKYLGSALFTDKNIQLRFFTHDITENLTNRRFEIYGCAFQNEKISLSHGVWTFDSTDEGAFILDYIEYF